VGAPHPERGAFNMAVDQALFETVQAGGPPVLRFYRWEPACLSLGRNQKATVNHRLLAASGIELVRRPTGGLAVLHDCELTYAVVVPLGVLGSPRQTYEAINRALLDGLLGLGLVSAVPARQDHTPQAFRTAGSCFTAPAPGEVIALGRKLIGSAQRCERRVILQHGSILIDGDQSRTDQFLETHSASPASNTTLRELLGRVPDWTELVQAFTDAFERHLGIPLAPAPLTQIERQRALELTAHFASAAWTWRVGSDE
jgi:lipoyl(octanoyl) transferase